ncbi:hypothetical protein [Chryseobacterium vrystaatense]|uniref:Plasminogen-binding protein PgbA N-terminal domain-containing protein n=1 Tax=Chryseobacterium vrystaatense TaxID=307480 RepID=A0A1M5D6F8_9FLAO|nr:hypothetical protein [Chryseobacterium vrystaatense]SHF62619.1 hypothetical protein SAMN02787073_2493 [Chryseobacterium vrystaatense]
MKNILVFFNVFIFSMFVSGQNTDASGFVETKIEGGSTFKKYKNGKLDSMVVTMAAVNYGNALLFSQTKNAVIISNAQDKNSLIKIELKNKKQVRTFLYKDKPVIITEGIDFDINNLPKNAKIFTSISSNIVNSTIVYTNYDHVADDNPDKTYKLFYRLDIRSDLSNLGDIFNNIGDFFTQEDSILKIYSGKYAEKFAPDALASLQTDSSGKIKDGIILDFKNPKNNEKDDYSIYKNGKIIKSGKASLKDYQNIFIDYREEVQN